MKRTYKPIIVAISLFFALSTSISAAPGDLDTTFGVGGKVIDGSGYVFDVAIQPDGKIVTVSGNIADFVVARYNQDGSPDTTFGFGTGKLITDLGREDIAWNIVIQPDGKIVAGGVSATNGAAFFFIVRYNSDGSFDTGFGGGTGKVLTALPCGDASDNYGADFAIQPDGKFVGAVKFEYCTGYLIRYESDGSLDVSFGNHGFVTEPIGGPSFIGGSSSNWVLIQPNGKVIWGVEYSGVYRYEPNGSPDLSFGSGGHVSCPFSVTSVIIQPDGKVVAFGTHPNSYALIRYNINGSPDTSFGLNGLVTAPIGAGYLGSAAIQPDGKIVTAGSSIGINGTRDFTLVRYNGDGSLDGTFGGGDGITTVDFNNSDDGAIDVALDSQGRAVVVGTIYPQGNTAIARFLGDPTPTCPNPIDCPDFFISQQYRDFLGREPESSCQPNQCGLDFYLPILNGCAASDAECLKYTRGALSANFFRSPEFQAKGSYVMYLYMVAIGQRPLTVAELQDASKIERPHYSEFITDMAAISSPNDRNGPDPAKKAALTQDFVQRAEIVAKYPTSTYPTLVSFGNALAATAGVNLSLATQNAIAAATTRAQVLQIVAESAEVNTKFYQPTFVTMEYFGYLRRDPENCHDPANWWGTGDPNQCGYIFHNNRFNTLPLDPDLVQNFIVRGFIESPEYRHRFGP